MSLFAGRLAGGFSGGRRCPLDASSWVDHFPGWLAQPDALFAALAEHAPWEQRSRWMFTNVVVEPRLTAEFDSITVARARVPELQRVADDISRHYGVTYDSTWMNLYRDQEDSTGCRARAHNGTCLPARSWRARRTPRRRHGQRGRHAGC